MILRSAGLLHCICYSHCKGNSTSAENIQNPGPRGALNEQKLLMLSKITLCLKMLSEILKKMYGCCRTHTSFNSI